ncbi:MAG: rhodanese-like domain-containing protein [Eggerthellaceae bacterium]|nr:rhodanese-like domain-containing protein [Eggerthellaceae bacterium]
MQRKTVLAVAILAALGVAALVGCTASSRSSVSTSASTSASSAAYRQISQQDAQAMMQSESSYVIVDVRRADEFASGHIPGAINIPNESIDKTQPAELPDLDQLIMVYCRSGRRSKQAAQKLADMGYTNIVEFGGINTWPGEVVAD